MDGEPFHKKKPFYGWVIVASSVILLAMGLGMFTSTNSAFVKPVCDSLGFARGQFTLHRTFITLIGACVMPLYGKLIQNLGPKKILLAGALMLSLISVGYSFSTKLWHFYLLAVVNGFFYNSLSFMTVGILVSSWFQGKKGFATGLAYSGSGLGGAIMIPIAGRIIELTSWQWAYRFMGMIGLLVLLPVVLFLVKDNPAELGLEPMAPDQAEESAGQIAPNVCLTFQEALYTWKFWMLVIAFFLTNLFAGAVNTHSTAYLSDLGHSTSFVSSVISLLMVMLTLGKILLGYVYDRFGSMAGNLLVAVFSLCFPVLALFSHIPAVPWFYAISVGMASCGVSVPISILLIRYFGEKDFPAIFSFCSMVSVFSPSISIPAMGAVYDATGSYRPAWIACFFVAVIIAVCLVGAEMLNRRDVRNTAEQQVEKAAEI